MTSEAPKTVLIVWTKGGKGAIMTKPKDGPPPENMSKSYTLTTHALAMVAAEREACAKVAETYFCDAGYYAYHEKIAGNTIAAAIRARTTADERAALDALLKAEREAGRVDGLREAAEEIGNLHCIASTSQLRLAMSALTETGMDAILALIEKETGQ